jgi:hypothetical protein
MARRLAAAGIGIALLAAGCGGHNSRAKAVSQYIDDVNAIQRNMQIPLADVAVRNRELQNGAKLETQRPKLEQSARTLRTLERRLDALEPPLEAERLDSLMRRAVHAEWELAHELTLVAVYAQASKAPLAHAAAAQTRVRAALTKARKPAAQAVALDGFARALDGVAAQLRRLRPPPTLAPQHRTSIRMYDQIAASARVLAAALRHGKDTARPLHELQVATASGSSIAAQKARIAAVVAYNRRGLRAKRLFAEAQNERTRLERTL